MDPIEDGLRVTLIMMVIAGIILDLFSIKWRYLTNIFMYLECFTRFIVTLIPNYASYEYDDIGYTMLFVLSFLLLYNDDGKQIICNTFTMAWHMFFAL